MINVPREETRNFAVKFSPRERDRAITIHEIRFCTPQVKDICNELDVRSLCHKILQNVSTLLHADRGSLFLVQGERSGAAVAAAVAAGHAGAPFSQNHEIAGHTADDEGEEVVAKAFLGNNEGPLCNDSQSPYARSRCLVSKLFDVCSRSTLLEMEKKDEIKIPWGTGIVGYVAESGEPVNIPDAYKAKTSPRILPRFHFHSSLTTPGADDGAVVEPSVVTSILTRAESRRSPLSRRITRRAVFRISETRERE